MASTKLQHLMFKITDMHEVIVLKYWFSYCPPQMVPVINGMLFFHQQDVLLTEFTEHEVNSYKILHGYMMYSLYIY